MGGGGRQVDIALGALKRGMGGDSKLHSLRIDHSIFVHQFAPSLSFCVPQHLHDFLGIMNNQNNPCYTPASFVVFVETGDRLPPWP